MVVYKNCDPRSDGWLIEVHTRHEEGWGCRNDYHLHFEGDSFSYKRDWFSSLGLNFFEELVW